VGDDGGGAVTRRWLESAKKVVWIGQKDARIYYFKGPNVTFGLFLPLVLYWAFALDRDIALAQVIPGLIAVAIFFGAGAIQAISLPLERRTGTLHTLLATPVTLPIVVIGKTLAGLIFGVILAAAYMVVAMLFLSFRPNIISFGLGVLLSAFCFSGFGLCLAAPFRDVPQAMPPATVVRIFIVFLSGAFAPLGDGSGIWTAIARLSPLTYSIDALYAAVAGPTSIAHSLLQWGVLFVYGLLFLGITLRVLGRQEI